MQSDKNKIQLRKDDVYNLLKEFANQYRKYGKGLHSEITIVGGSSILLNYGFRETTVDIDAILDASSVAKDIILSISDKHNIQSDWLNDGIKYTKSFSDKLRKVSNHFCSFNHGDLEIRTVKAQYLIAMKLMSSRDYSQDISDVIGILMKEKESGNHITYDDIVTAMELLYPNRYDLPEIYVEEIKRWCSLSSDALESEYNNRVSTEFKIKEITDNYLEEDMPGKDVAKNIARAVALRLSENDD